MGVYIKNIDIPEIKRGAAAIINIDDIVFFKTADDILLVPDHGDLIDRDELIEKFGMCVCDFGTPDERWRPDRDWYIGINAQTIIIHADRSIDKDKDVLCKSAEKSEEECEDENWYTELDDPKIAERSEE